MFSWKNGSTIYPLTKKVMTVRNKEFPILKIFTSLWNKKNINKRIKKIINNKFGSIKEKRLFKATDEKDNSKRVKIT